MLKNILFVDDDQNLLSSLKRVMHQYKKEWIMFFAGSGDEALEIMNNDKFDIIFADYKMPGMNGIELLTIVKEKYPDTKRILLTGQSEKEIYTRAQTVVHKYIAKPCDYSQILSEISKS